ncbi:MAG: hypothetical protein K0R94_1107 [Burkholderiales bacterium]|jgi:type II secretory pathway component PulM|nr:hypothetical protein [Burkholderiales bacterium]
MKNLMLKLRQSNSHPKIKLLATIIAARLKPVNEYYKRLNERDKQIVFFGGILAILMFFFLVINAAYTFQKSLEKEYTIIQTYKADVEFLSKVYKDISTLTPNEFSPVEINSIKNDLAAISSETPDVQLVDNTLTINIAQAKFSDILNLLQQFRKSYGLFVFKARVTRLPESGYVSFSASFKVNTQNGQ